MRESETSRAQAHHNRAARKSESETKVSQRKMGGHQMRRDDEPIKEDSEAVGFIFHFQITNGVGRKACSIRVQAHNYHDATMVVRQNWPTIELMARES
jgi:hypothetical protein